ncbi:MAG: hypothetical protein KVP17_002646 [Porospora cf. gigantea B]|uniref:uncharacterized protein n=1 Tax=Porospora cf. gigantea B TaxID=2853592 RepID=UPI003571E10E|nr:MAG: hypothetical protein KVP17_002646 [Porospora cf. gigantea B]
MRMISRLPVDQQEQTPSLLTLASSFPFPSDPRQNSDPNPVPHFGRLSLQPTIHQMPMHPQSMFRPIMPVGMRPPPHINGLPMWAPNSAQIMPNNNSAMGGQAYCLPPGHASTQPVLKLRHPSENSAQPTLKLRHPDDVNSANPNLRMEHGVHQEYLHGGFPAHQPPRPAVLFPDIPPANGAAPELRNDLGAGAQGGARGWADEPQNSGHCSLQSQGSVSDDGFHSYPGDAHSSRESQSMESLPPGEEADVAAWLKTQLQIVPGQAFVYATSTGVGITLVTDTGTNFRPIQKINLTLDESEENMATAAEVFKTFVIQMILDEGGSRWDVADCDEEPVASVIALFASHQNDKADKDQKRTVLKYERKDLEEYKKHLAILTNNLNRVDKRSAYSVKNLSNDDRPVAKTLKRMQQTLSQMPPQNFVVNRMLVDPREAPTDAPETHLMYGPRRDTRRALMKWNKVQLPQMSREGSEAFMNRYFMRAPILKMSDMSSQLNVGPNRGIPLNDIPFSGPSQAQIDREIAGTRTDTNEMTRIYSREVSNYRKALAAPRAAGLHLPGSMTVDLLTLVKKKNKRSRPVNQVSVQAANVDENRQELQEVLLSIASPASQPGMYLPTQVRRGRGHDHVKHLTESAAYFKVNGDHRIVPLDFQEDVRRIATQTILRQYSAQFQTSYEVDCARALADLANYGYVSQDRAGLDYIKIALESGVPTFPVHNLDQGHDHLIPTLNRLENALFHCTKSPRVKVLLAQTQFADQNYPSDSEALKSITELLTRNSRATRTDLACSFCGGPHATFSCTNHTHQRAGIQLEIVHTTNENGDYAPIWFMKLDLRNGIVSPSEALMCWNLLTRMKQISPSSFKALFTQPSHSSETSRYWIQTSANLYSKRGGNGRQRILLQSTQDNSFVTNAGYRWITEKMILNAMGGAKICHHCFQPGHVHSQCTGVQVSADYDSSCRFALDVAKGDTTELTVSSIATGATQRIT